MNNCTSSWKMEGEARSSSRKRMCLGVPVCLWGKRYFPIELLFSRVRNSKRHLQGDHSILVAGIFSQISPQDGMVSKQTNGIDAVQRGDERRTAHPCSSATQAV